MAIASQIFSNENSHNSAMIMELKSIFKPLKSTIYCIDNKKFSNSVLVTNIRAQVCYQLIFKEKKELYATKAEPTLQASLYYHVQKGQRPVLLFLIYVGHCRSLNLPSQSIYIDKVIIESLTDFISLIPKLGDDSQVSQIAQFLAALNFAMSRFNNYYQNLQLNNDSPNDQRYFPYFSTYQDKNNNRIGFKYIHLLTEDFQRPIWKAKAKNRSIVIKFARRYGVKAYNICAKLRLAPNLLYSENLQNGFMMIVMDYVDGDPLTT
ncbi:3932_t:CDS:2 [Funneliformis mosseae]|uniref:3932_t:CDS:1 n=1 Tax=Funneliformis mosseae TaxID=27381 RepID=A0A9N9AWY0_FUNMO|nr:3932_t:CDS:2 [Funneliformis mosseae]